MLRHPPDPFPALDGDLGAHGQVDDVLAEVEEALERERGERWRRSRAVRTGDRDAVLDVLADVGVLVVDDGDHQDRVPEQAGGMELVARQELVRLRRVDREAGHQRLHAP